MTTASTTTPTTTVTTTNPTTATTTTLSGGQHIQRYPEKVMGFYLPLADETEEGFETDADWEPSLYPYQQEAANVLFFTFINPETMVVPKAFEKLAATRGTGAEGAVPADTSGLILHIYNISINILFSFQSFFLPLEATVTVSMSIHGLGSLLKQRLRTWL